MKLSGMRLMGPRDLSMLSSIRRTMLGPCLGHIRAMLWLFYNIFASGCLKWLKFSQELYMPKQRTLLNVDIMGPYWGHVWAILGPCFGYFYNIFASRCMKRLKFSLESHAYQVEEYYLMSIYWDHIRTMFGQYEGHIRAIFLWFLQYLCF